MDKRKDAETKAVTPSTSDETPPPAPPAADGTQETQIALALIETLKIGPTKTEAPEIPRIAMSPSLAPDIEIENPAPLADAPMQSDTPKPVELPQPELFAFSPPPSPAPETAGGESTSAEQTRSNRFALLAASVAIAAGIGAMTGALAAIALSGSPAPAPVSPLAAIDLSALHDTIGKMRSEIAALRAGVDTGARTSNSQFAKVTERFDRLDRAQADAAKLAKAQDKPNDVTGSVSPPPRPPATTPSEPPSAVRPGVVEGWVVRSVNRGVAVIQGRRMGVIEIERGDIVPGLGRIEAIRRQDGHWVVVTAKGLIVSQPR